MPEGAMEPELEVMANASDFQKELTSLLNRHSKKNGSNTPDFILANYLLICLSAFDNAVIRREQWYGRYGTRSAPGFGTCSAQHPSPANSGVGAPYAIRQAVARAYCDPRNSSKVLDPDLCDAIAKEVVAALGKQE